MLSREQKRERESDSATDNELRQVFHRSRDELRGKRLSVREEGENAVIIHRGWSINNTTSPMNYDSELIGRTSERMIVGDLDERRNEKKNLGGKISARKIS